MRTIFLFVLVINFLFASELEKVSIQLNWKYQFEFAGFIAAKEKGFYKEAGLDVEIKEYEANKDVVFDVLNKNSTYGVSNSNIILDNGKIASVVLLASYLQKSPLVLITKPNIKHPRELANKVIMGGKDELKYSSLALLFSHFNINSLNSKFVQHSFDLNDFINGKVDAMSAFKSNQLYELDRRKIPYNIIDPNDYGFLVSAINLFTSKDEILKNQERSQKIIEATNRGWEYALKNKDEIIDILIEKYGVKKSKASLLYEANVVDELVMKELYPIGKVSLEFTKRLLKQLIFSGAIDSKESVAESIVFENYLSSNKKGFTLLEDEKKYLNSKNSLKMCIDPDWYPIESIKNGKILGITSDVKNYFEEKLDIKIELVPTKDWNESIEFIKNKRCDIISSISPSSERDSYLNFTEPIFSLPMVLATKNNKPFIQDITYLKDKKIAIIKNHFMTDYLKEYFPNINLVEVPNINTGLKILEEENVYGYIDNSLVLSSIIQKEYANSLKIALRFDIKDDISFGTIKDEPILNQILSRLVNDLDDGVKQEFLNNWTAIVEQVGWLKTKDIVIISIILIIVLFSMIMYQNNLKHFNKELEKLSSTDKLTGLFNRFEIDKQLNIEKNKVDRNENYISSLIILDIDLFKNINDTLGHLVGDKVLKELSLFIKNHLRKIDTIGRWGGEEFIIILPFTDKNSAKVVAENLRKSIENHKFLSNKSKKITVSLGVGELLKENSIEESLYITDKALYEAKNSGRNKVVSA